MQKMKDAGKCRRQQGGKHTVANEPTHACLDSGTRRIIGARDIPDWIHGPALIFKIVNEVHGENRPVLSIVTS
jgi:hypothetical protein